MKKLRQVTLYAGPAGVRHPGTVFQASDQEAAVLVGGGFAVEISEPAAPAKATPATAPEAPEAAADVKHVGGGVYELPDGRRVRGHAAALEALAGEVDAKD